MRKHYIASVSIGDALTPRENEILVFVGKGFTNDEVGSLLKIGRHTVNDHMKSIYKKLDVDSRVEAAVWACKQGML